MVARACLDGHPAGFFLEPVIRHHHRRKQAQGEALARRFAIGRGAFWAKMLLSHRAYRTQLCKGWYWMMRSAIRRNKAPGLIECLREIVGALRYLARPRASVRP
jgi:hypothetical protein